MIEYFKRFEEEGLGYTADIKESTKQHIIDVRESMC